jgi:hypothetical protein
MYTQFWWENLLMKNTSKIKISISQNWVTEIWKLDWIARGHVPMVGSVIMNVELLCFSTSKLNNSSCVYSLLLVHLSKNLSCFLILCQLLWNEIYHLLNNFINLTFICRCCKIASFPQRKHYAKTIKVQNS